MTSPSRTATCQPRVVRVDHEPVAYHHAQRLPALARRRAALPAQSATGRADPRLRVARLRAELDRMRAAYAQAGAGGLYVIGTGRHTSSRLDDQLRGRAGRQGDPGGSVFFTSLEDDLVLRYAPDTDPATDIEPDGRMRGRRGLLDLAHAQRVAEGVNLEIHRNTWRYNRLIERQRGIVLAHRDRLLRTDLAGAELDTRCRPRCEEIRASVGQEVLTEAARLIALHHLDRRWTEHLACLSDIREAIHLHALSRANPLDEFHRAAIPVFRTILPEATDRAVATFQHARVTAAGLDLADAGIKRPSATWTYMVHDSPLDSDFQRTVKRIRALMRGTRTSAKDRSPRVAAHRP